MNSNTLSLKKNISKLYLLQKEVIIQWNFCCSQPNRMDNWIEKEPDSCNAKEHYQSFIRKKNTKLVKQSKVIS